jgi:predicted CoA-binding protein
VTVRTIREILEESTTIAVVGASANPEKPAHAVPAALQQMGFGIVPVNPTLDEVLGETAYPSLAEIPENITIDIVQVFRRPADVPPVAHEAVAVGARVLWLQSGITSEVARAIADAGGLDYVEDRCLMVEARTRSITKTQPPTPS